MYHIDTPSSPEHYSNFSILKALDELSFFKISMYKYIFRAGKKDKEKYFEDLQKAWNCALILNNKFHFYMPTKIQKIQQIFIKFFMEQVDYSDEDRNSIISQIETIYHQ